MDFDLAILDDRLTDSSPQNPKSKIQNRLPLPLVCLVTDRRAVAGSLVEAVARAVDGGVNMVQVREKELPAGELLRLVCDLRGVVAGRALLVVNDRVDVALAADADGVHLPGHGLPPLAARSLVGERLVGRSVHSAGEASEAGEQGADYALLGAIFASRSHPGQPGAGPELIRLARPCCRVPLLGIGGITPENAASVMEAGADGVAVISAILAAPDPAEAAARLCEMVEAAWEKARVRVAPCFR